MLTSRAVDSEHESRLRKCLIIELSLLDLMVVMGLLFCGPFSLSQKQLCRPSCCPAFRLAALQPPPRLIVEAELKLSALEGTR